MIFESMFKSYRWFALVTLGCLFLQACSTSVSKEDQLKAATLQHNKAKAILIHQMHSGDLALRLGNDLTSFTLSQLNNRNKSYSHCGIVSIENGNIYIYHAIGGEYNPNQKLKRETPETWFSPVHNIAIGLARYSMDSLQKLALVEQVKTYYREEKEFDMQFDLATNDKLYCAEMVYKAVQISTHDSAFLPTTTRFGKHYVGVDDLFLNQHCKLIGQQKFK